MLPCAVYWSEKKVTVFVTIQHVFFEAHYLKKSTSFPNVVIGNDELFEILVQKLQTAVYMTITLNSYGIGKPVCSTKISTAHLC